MTVNHPQWGTMCEICFEQVTGDNAATDRNGDRWDVHTGECARQAGITAPSPTLHAEHHNTKIITSGTERTDNTPRPVYPDRDGDGNG